MLYSQYADFNTQLALLLEFLRKNKEEIKKDNLDCQTSPDARNNAMVKTQIEFLKRNCNLLNQELEKLSNELTN